MSKKQTNKAAAPVAVAKEVSVVTEVTWLPQPVEHPLIEEIKVAKGTRSFVVPPSDARVEPLVKSIEGKKLLQQITLARVQDSKKYEVVAGAGRLAALNKMRPGERLHADEYRIISMYSDDERIPAYSAAENTDRTDPSPYEDMKLAKHLVKDLKLKEEKVGQIMGKNTSIISNLITAERNFEGLPKVWREELKKASSEKPAITFGHVRSVLKHFDAQGKLPKDARDIMEKAAKEAWSVAKMEDAFSSDAKKKDTEIMKTDGIEVPDSPGIENKNVTASPRADEGNSRDGAAATPLERMQSWAQKLGAIAGEMQAYPSLKNKVLDAVKAAEAQIAKLSHEEAA